MFDDFFRLSCLQLLKGLLSESARIAGMSLVDLFFSLFAGYFYLLRIDDDDVVAAVYVRGISRLVLSSQYGSNFRSQSAESLAFCIDDVPFAFDFCRFCNVRFHDFSFLPTEIAVP